MSYNQKTQQTKRTKKFIIGMVTAGVFAAGLAVPSAASAISLGNVNANDPAPYAVDLGTMSNGNLQGSTTSTQGYDMGTSSTQASTTGSSAGWLQVEQGDSSVHGTTQASGSGKIQTQSNNDSSGSVENSTDTSAELQGGAGLNLDVSGSTHSLFSY